MDTTEDKKGQPAYNVDGDRLTKLDPANAQPNAAGNLLMDYEKLAEEKGMPASPEKAQPHIGLIGGQSPDDESGLDVKDYESWSDSKSSTQIEIPEAPYGTGPDNGIKKHNKG